MKYISCLMTILYFLFICLTTINAEQNISNYEILKDYSTLDTIDDETLDKCITLMRQIHKSGGSTPLEPSTYYYGLICLKSSSDKGALSYIEYLLSNKRSVEEQLSFSFEPIFYKKPEIVLLEISKLVEADKTLLLGKIGWGFINNNHVNQENYKEIFLKKDDRVEKLYKKYKKEFDQIFKRIDSYYEWLENQ